MVIDYSKWDNLELSDDSDIEVHPNVDKKSFIRWKQRDIHEKRHVRTQEKEQLRFELEMNGKLLARIDKILDALKSHTPSASEAGNPNAADEFVLKTMFATTSEVDKQRATGAPDSAPTYGQMITKLADKVAGEIPKDTDKFEGFKNGFQKHRDELAASNEKSKQKLEEMEKEDAKKITSDGLRTGFDSTHITKASDLPAPAPAESSSSQPKKKKLTKTKVQQVEVLNPNAVQKPPGAVSDSISSGAEADVEEGEEGEDDDDDDDDDEDMKVSELGKRFAQLKLGDYRAYAEFISKNPTVLAEKETDGLLIEAFNSQMDGKDDYARQCVHQALLLQYCRQLGRDGVALFFKRITTPNHQAQKVFQDDVNQTYNRIRTRAKEIKAERAADTGGAEQIQLHAVDPNTQITIGIPPENSDDPAEQESRKIFETFPPGLRRALESGSLDEVNTVLGKMAVEEAEEVVGKLSAGGMLSLEESIIDATTEEGKAKLAEIEKGEQGNKGKGKAVSTTELE